jgi:uncharacterized membrane protein (UPF0127 family)
LHKAFKIYKRLKKITTIIKSRKYNLWVANNNRTRANGLSLIDKLPKGWGMIFIYDEDVRHSFTMEKTKIPLQIIFLDKNFKINQVFNCRAFQKGAITPKEKYRYVIEI